ncbi:MAG: septal ring lytic transglycosylase RlpA family protein [Thermodesulfobacteriota bacterium]
MINSYQVQRGDTIRQVTRRLNTDWQTLKRQNPEAIGRSKRNGNWFVREGATVEIKDSAFQQTLTRATSGPRPDSDKPTPPLKLQCDKNSINHTIKPGETLWELAVRRYHVNLSDIIKANNIKNPRTLQPGQVILIPMEKKKGPEQVVASWYGKEFHGKPMANGDIYNMHGNTVAHKEIPLGTSVQLTNASTGQSVQAVVTDRGPYIEGRDVDLSYNLARRLSLLEKGVGDLIMTTL